MHILELKGARSATAPPKARTKGDALEQILARLVQVPGLEAARVRVERRLDRVRLEPRARRKLGALLRPEQRVVAHPQARVPEHHCADAQVPHAVALSGIAVRGPREEHHELREGGR